MRSKYVSALFPDRGLSLATPSAVSRTPGMGGFLIYPLIYPIPRGRQLDDERGAAANIRVSFDVLGSSFACDSETVTSMPTKSQEESISSSADEGRG